MFSDEVPAMHQLISMANPVLLPAAGLLRPSFGHFPIILLFLCLLWIGLLRRTLPGFGRRATLLSFLLVGFLVASWLPRIAAGSWGKPFLTPSYYRFVILPSTVVQMSMLLMLLSAPIWVPLSLLARRVFRRAAPALPVAPPPAADPGVAPAADPVSAPLPAPAGLSLSRRQALTALSWAAPGAALFLSGYGVLESRRLIVRRMKIAVPGLPPALRGLRIGQVTDVHVSYDLTPIDKLARGCELLAGERLDLMIATGDLCDNARQYADVLGLIGQVPARLGHFASLGNHELHLPLRFVRRTYEHSSVHLLEDESVTLPNLALCAVGFPVRGAANQGATMLDSALSGREGEPFTLVLSHHPHVFKQVGERNVGLMLSGHTHGGQMGVGERSVIEPAYGLVRGLYRADGSEAPADDGGEAKGGEGGTDKGKSPQLFVSSGLGHWLPWRLNCPPEVVVIELA
jgi:predicted MPP superfamily phosphohydrolase